jgi:kynureninase
VLRTHYRSFLRPGRVLLTGHSHQAWPDKAREGILRAFDDAAEHVDDKWSRAFEVAEVVRDCIAQHVGGTSREVALASNTHELVARFLSALPLRTRPRLVTTTGEFHTLYRQLRRLSEEGVAVTFVDAHPVETLAERLLAEVNHDVAAVLTSTVLFETSSIVSGLKTLVSEAKKRGAEVLLDVYHAMNVVPMGAEDTHGAFVTGGGYKYAQWGEGVCFLRVPKGCELRPVYTGWFADFAHLAERRSDVQVTYASDGAERFAGATYDPTSHYRAAEVIAFFREQGLTVEVLRALSLRQTERIIQTLDAAGLAVVTPKEPTRRGGFVSVRCDHASTVVDTLRRGDVWVDARGDLVRLGPAPYTTDDEIDQATAALIAAVRLSVVRKIDLKTPQLPLVVSAETFDGFAWSPCHTLEWHAPDRAVVLNGFDGTLPLRWAFVFRERWEQLPAELAWLHTGRDHAREIDLSEDAWALAPYAIDDATDLLWEHKRSPGETFWLAADNVNALFWALHDWAHYHNHGDFTDRPSTELQCDVSALVWLWINRKSIELPDSHWNHIREGAIEEQQRLMAVTTTSRCTTPTLLQYPEKLWELASQLSL